MEWGIHIELYIMYIDHILLYVMVFSVRTKVIEDNPAWAYSAVMIGIITSNHDTRCIGLLDETVWSTIKSGEDIPMRQFSCFKRHPG